MWVGIAWGVYRSRLNNMLALKFAVEQLGSSMVNPKRSILPSSLAQKHNLSYSILTTYNEKIGAEKSRKINQEKSLIPRLLF
jgi:hypothetical protein